MNNNQNQPIISWKNSEPHSNIFDDLYYSNENGLAESRYVFLEGNKLAERWQDLRAGQSFTIIETGFGTGLNFLAAWQLWDSMAETIPSSCTLHFLSIEKYPLSAKHLLRAHKAWPELKTYSEALTDVYPPHTWHDLQSLDLSKENKAGVQLTLIFKDIKTAFSLFEFPTGIGPDSKTQGAVLGENPLHAHAWFLDGFAPSKNPEMWSNELYLGIKNNSHAGASFATFTAAGSVRRALLTSGFKCEKKKGYGKKREMLTGYYEPTETDYSPVSESRLLTNEEQTKEKTKKKSGRELARNSTKKPSWPFKKRKHVVRHHDKCVAIIGAGLAGCHVANALARRGFSVKIVDSKTIASGASSNIQGAVYTRLSNSDEPLSYFNRSAQIFADAFYQYSGIYKQAGEQCGVLHQAIDQKAERRLLEFARKHQESRDFSYLNPEEASNIAGVELQKSGLFCRRSGWLSPADVCKRLVSHEKIEVFEHQTVRELHFNNNNWHLLGDDSVISAPICIVANAAAARTFSQLHTLPLNRIRGQVNHLESNAVLSKIKTVICGHGYLTPATELGGNALHSVGATFNLQSLEPTIDQRDTAANLQTLFEISSEFKKNEISTCDHSIGKVGFRTSTPDYLPIVGPVPKIKDLLQDFQLLSKKANAQIDTCGEYYPGLYCSLGFGSRGLAYTPLAANILAQLIAGSYLPLPLSLYEHLNPARFTIRSLIKNKVHATTGSNV